jgi:DNA repair exonuclease SbcCD ATPase subunit
MSRGDLEAQVHDGDRAQATAPPDMSSQLRVTAQAAADAWQQSADAKVEHDQEQAENARSLAAALAVQMNRLEAADERFEEWSARTASTREIAGKAKAELQRRGQQPPGREAPGPQSMTAWWREFQADVDAVDRAIDREHQAAVYDSQPWPPERKPEAGREEPYACAPGQPQPEAAGPNPADDGRAARLDELQARADQAARRIDAQRAELDASSQHTARVEREAQAGPAAGQQAETSYDMEMEL